MFCFRETVHVTNQCVTQFVQISPASFYQFQVTRSSYYGYVNMDPRNIYGNEGQRHIPQNGPFNGNRPDSAGGPGSAQTSNQASNIYNFYFVNSGNYDLALGGPGAPGARHPQEFQPITPNESRQMFQNLMNPGAAANFSQGQQPPNPFGNGTNANWHAVHPFPGAPSAFAQISAPTPVGGGHGQHTLHQPAFGTANASNGSSMIRRRHSFNTSGGNCGMANPPSTTAMEPYNNYPPMGYGPQFQGYRQLPDTSFTSLSQNSRSFRDDEDEDVICNSQCSSQKAAAHYGGFYRPDPPY